MNRLLFLVVCVGGCGSSSTLDASTPDASTLDAGTDVSPDGGVDANGPVELSVRVGHFVPDLGQPLHFCLSARGDDLAAFPPTAFRNLSESITLTIPAGLALEVVASPESDCSDPILSTTVEEPLSLATTIAAVGFVDISQPICGASYGSPCPSQTAVHPAVWVDDVASTSGARIRFVNLAPNSFVTKICEDPDGLGPLPPSEIASASAEISEPIDVDPTGSAEWFVIRSSVMLEGCAGSPDVLATIAIPTPDLIASRSERILRTLGAGDVVTFVGSGVVAFPRVDDERALEFAPWLDGAE